MILNGTIVTGIDEDEGEIVDIIKEFLEQEGYNEGIEIEALGVIDPNTLAAKMDGTDDDFTLEFHRKSDNFTMEYRFVHDQHINEVFNDYVEENYDKDRWREEVSNQATEDGFSEWQSDVITNAEYGEVMGTYDGIYDELGDYIIMRMS